MKFAPLENRPLSSFRLRDMYVLYSTGMMGSCWANLNCSIDRGTCMVERGLASELAHHARKQAKGVGLLFFFFYVFEVVGFVVAAG